MMELRILTKDELRDAVKLAQGVFAFCLQKTLQFPESVRFFGEYVNENNLGMLMEQGRLTLWGIYNEGHLIAMSGMQSEGHITMLYVLPLFQRQGYGGMLLHAMRVCAKDRGLSDVTVNALPAWTAQYFSRQGFRAANYNQAGAALFVPMQARAIHEVRFERKPIPAGWLIGTTVGGLSLCMLVAIIFMMGYIM